MMIKAFTDYPFTEELRGTVFPVEVLTYDRDKYCKVRLPNGNIDECKAGYLFLDEKLEKWLGNLIFTLPYKIDDVNPTRIQTVSEIRNMKRRKTYYKVFHDLKYREFSTLKNSLKYMNKITNDVKNKDDIELSRYKEGKGSWEIDPLLILEKDDIGYSYIQCLEGKISKIKNRHIKKYFR